MPKRIVPSVGDWFCFPQNVVRMDKNAPATKEHRWMVGTSGLLPRTPIVFLRSTKPYGGIPHEAHDGACGYVGCRIDKPGWIRDTVIREVSIREFTVSRKSCQESDEGLIDKIMGLGEKYMRRRARRGPRRGTRR